jgi:nitroimidazol reductase NimA-like FMN-containing flavoprotein (pyridoxamine 5'-phosphate oxidase superfamily)
MRGAMPKLAQAEVEEFLAGPRICRLGCVDSDGFPLVVPCNYLFEGDAFYVMPRARALWGECLKKIGHCFLCIDAREGPYGDQWNTRVLIKGEARLLVRRAYGRASDRRDQR